MFLKKQKVFSLFTFFVLFEIVCVQGVFAVSNVTINATVPAICGNSVVEGAEGCDDGNLVDGDACSNACVVNTVCGNGVIEGAEACDDGNAVDTDACSNACVVVQAGRADGGGGAPAPAPAPAPVPAPVPNPDPVVPVPDPVVPVPEPVVPVPDPVVPVPDPVPAPVPVPVVPAPPPAPNPAPNGEAGGNQGAGVNGNAAEGGAQDGGRAGNGGAAGEEGGAANAGGNVDGQGPVAQGGLIIPPDFFEGARSVVSSTERVSRTVLQFAIANGTIKYPAQNGVVETQAGDTVSLHLSEFDLASRSVQSIQASVLGKTYPLTWNEAVQEFQTKIPVPGLGRYDGIIGIIYVDGAADSQTFSFIGKPLGMVREKGTDAPLDGVQVTLLDISTGEKVWSGNSFLQINPKQTGKNGTYGFVVPNGEYKLQFVKSGYRTYTTNSFVILNNIVSEHVSMIPSAPTLASAIKKDANLVMNIKNVTIAAAAITKEYTQVAEQVLVDVKQKVDKIADNPQVEKVTEQVVAPVATTVAVATVAPSLWSVLFPLLRFLFLQPVLLFGKKKRSEWGVVYNSLNKLPIDLAVVRLIDLNTKRVKQSRVTDLHGRFLFMSEPGEYMIEVSKPGFVFPSNVLAKVVSDGRMVDIYHGEKIGVTGKSVAVTPNIPIDPSGEQKTPARILKEKRMQLLQHVVSLSGIGLTLVSLYISPVWYMWIFLGIHVAMYFVFKYFVKPRKPKGWGIVAEHGTKKPLGQVVIRLFTKEYNKLVSTQTSDSNGRYAFLVGPSNYYITVEKPGFETFKSEDISIVPDKKTEHILKKDVLLKKKAVA